MRLVGKLSQAGHTDPKVISRLIEYDEDLQRAVIVDLQQANLDKTIPEDVSFLLQSDFREDALVNSRLISSIHSFLSTSASRPDFCSSTPLLNSSSNRFSFPTGASPISSCLGSASSASSTASSASSGAASNTSLNPTSDASIAHRPSPGSLASITSASNTFSITNPSASLAPGSNASLTLTSKAPLTPASNASLTSVVRKRSNVAFALKSPLVAKSTLVHRIVTTSTAAAESQPQVPSPKAILSADDYLAKHRISNSILQKISAHPFPKHLTLSELSKLADANSLHIPSPTSYHRRFADRPDFLKDSFRGEALPGVFRPSSSGLSEQEAEAEFLDIQRRPPTSLVELNTWIARTYPPVVPTFDPKIHSIELEGFDLAFYGEIASLDLSKTSGRSRSSTDITPHQVRNYSSARMLINSSLPRYRSLFKFMLDPNLTTIALDLARYQRQSMMDTQFLTHLCLVILSTRADCWTITVFLGLLSDPTP